MVLAQTVSAMVGSWTCVVLVPMVVVEPPPQGRPPGHPLHLQPQLPLHGHPHLLHHPLRLQPRLPLHRQDLHHLLCLTSSYIPIPSASTIPSTSSLASPFMAMPISTPSSTPLIYMPWVSTITFLLEASLTNSIMHICTTPIDPPPCQC